MNDQQKEKNMFYCLQCNEWKERPRGCDLCQDCIDLIDMEDYYDSEAEPEKPN
jgi:hypothetical protein